eukprot:303396_1
MAQQRLGYTTSFHGLVLRPNRIIEGNPNMNVYTNLSLQSMVNANPNVYINQTHMNQHSKPQTHTKIQNSPYSGKRSVGLASLYIGLQYRHLAEIWLSSGLKNPYNASVHRTWPYL